MIIRCSHCQNIIMPSDYKGVYRCSYCHVWLRENEVIKTESFTVSEAPLIEISSLPQEKGEKSPPGAGDEGGGT